MYYKLTDKDGYTRKGEHNQLWWGEGTEHTASGDSNELCSDAYIHAYENPYIAVFMNTIHGDYNLSTAHLYECELSGKIIRDGQLKCGGKTCKTLREIPPPVITTEQRVEIAIRISLKVYNDPNYVQWAEDWLSGKDRSKQAAEWAARAAREAACAAEAAAEWAAAKWAARAADIDIISIIMQVVNKDTK